MEIDLKIGERGKFKEFESVYKSEFLEKHEYHAYTVSKGFTRKYKICQSLQTKYGELVVKNSDVVTYVGHGIWSVSHEQTQR